MGVSVSLPDTGIVHLRYDTQEELTHTFVRLQEFYESPLPEIRGNTFSLANFLLAYRATFDSNYFTDWNGFNVPGHVVTDFFKRFTDLSAEEHDLAQDLIDTIGAETVAGDGERFYVIGTWKEEDVTHEIAHALFYLDRDYKLAMCEECVNLRAFSPHAAMCFEGWLRQEGYTPQVYADEVQAYFATNDADDWKKDFANIADLEPLAKPFREVFAKHWPPRVA